MREIISIHIGSAGIRFSAVCQKIRKHDASLPVADLLSPLHTAVKNGDTSVVRSLVADGVDVNVGFESGCSPLGCIPWHEQTDKVTAEILSLLLHAGARLHVLPRSPLVIASAYGNIAAVRILINFGCNVDDEYAGKSALCAAASGGHAEVVRELLIAGARKEAQVPFQVLLDPLTIVVPQVSKWHLVVERRVGDGHCIEGRTRLCGACITRFFHETQDPLIQLFNHSNPFFFFNEKCHVSACTRAGGNQRAVFWNF